MMGYSILIPHKSTPHNDLALTLNLTMLDENSTQVPEDVRVMTENEDPYMLWNRYGEQARSEALVFSNSDVLMAPGWDIMVKHVDDNSIVTGYLIEPGVIGVAACNIHKDFGKAPDKFHRRAFESFCATYGAGVPEVVEERAWYMPCVMTKAFFLRMGKFPCDNAFPHPNDILFWNSCVERGARLLRARSFAYHFQCLSNIEHDYKR
jgi:hypothetical protein